MFTGQLPMKPLEPTDLGFLAYIGRILRAQGADILISDHVLMARAQSTEERNHLRLTLVQHNATSSSSLGVFAMDYDERTLSITRVVS